VTRHNAALVMKRLTLFYDVATCFGLIVNNGEDDCNKKCAEKIRVLQICCSFNMMFKSQLFCMGVNPLTPNDPYRSRTAPLTSKVVFYIFIQQI
jgi:hypothetical protein